MSKTKFKIAVSNAVIVPVEGALKDENGAPKPFKFDLVARRTTSSEVGNNGGKQVKEILREIVTDVRGQRLVLLEDDTPAPFDADMLDALMDISGMAMLCYGQYLKEQSAAEKN